MRYLFIAMLVFSISNADYILKKSLACPTIMLIEKAPSDQGESGMELTLYSISNNCMILSRKDKIEALGYDPRDSKNIYQHILHKNSGSELFMKRANIRVEQGGKKNIMRF